MDTTSPRALRRAARFRQVRLAKLGTAREALGTITPHCEIFALTFGQFSLVDALVAIAEQTGPAHCELITWTLHFEHTQIIADARSRKSLLSARILVDRSFGTMKPDWLHMLREQIGDQHIRTCRTHAKLFTLHNKTWNITARSSANLNDNFRLEQIEISDDPQLRRFVTQALDDVFSLQAPGNFDGDLPQIDTIENVPAPGTPAMLRQPTFNRPPEFPLVVFGT